jgi:hypothetical protein
MQNDVSNNYILNGYDKPGPTSTYSYQNSNTVTTASRNLKKLPTSKNTNAAKINYRVRNTFLNFVKVMFI